MKANPISFVRTGVNAYTSDSDKLTLNWHAQGHSVPRTHFTESRYVPRDLDVFGQSADMLDFVFIQHEMCIDNGSGPELNALHCFFSVDQALALRNALDSALAAAERSNQHNPSETRR